MVALYAPGSGESKLSPKRRKYPTLPTQLVQTSNLDVMLALRTIVAGIAMQPSQLTFNNSPRTFQCHHFNSFGAV